MKILANDGLAASGTQALRSAGFEVVETHVAQVQLSNFINENNISAILVRSATLVKKELIDQCPGLKLIGRGGVGMDNIDVDYARKKGIDVINTPAASSDSVAELVFAHLFGGVRFLHDANRNMPLEGDQNFNQLKKSYSAGSELRGKTLGLIGLGKIGKATARLALAVGMKVIYYDPKVPNARIKVLFFDGRSISFELQSQTKDEVLSTADGLSLHIPAQKAYVIGKPEFKKMKKGTILINAARGGVLDEVALVDALEDGTVAFAGLDVFESEPTPEIRILMHPNISLTPHIGAATLEAQDRIGLALAQQIISLMK